MLRTMIGDILGAARAAIFGASPAAETASDVVEPTVDAADTGTPDVDPDPASPAAPAKPMLTLSTFMPDDSGSMNPRSKAGAVRTGHNAQLDEYENAPGKLLVRTRYLNGHVLFDFCEAKDAERMDVFNYAPGLGTPLYDETYKLLEEVQAAVALYEGAYEVFVEVRIMTDGEDSGSSRTAADVKIVVERLLASGYRIYGMGVGPNEPLFRQVFHDMGIPDRLIKVLDPAKEDVAESMREDARTTVYSTVSPDAFRHTTQTGYTRQPSDAGTDLGGWGKKKPGDET